MLYGIDMSRLPTLDEVYELERQTVWKCSHRRNVLVVVLGGECTFKVGKAESTLHKGDAILLPAGVEYERRPAGTETEAAAKFIYIHFIADIATLSKDEAEEYMRRAMATETINPIRIVGREPIGSRLILNDTVTIKDFDAFLSILRGAIDEYQSEQPLNRVMSSLSVTKLLTLLARQQLIDYAKPLTVADEDYLPTSLENALKYIKAHYNEKITVPELCAVSNITPQHLIRLFNRYLGNTPIKYVNHAKILSAIEMLRSTELSIKEISYELGFDNPNYFSRIFSREVGMSPMEKREQIRLGEKKASIPKQD